MKKNSWLFLLMVLCLSVFIVACSEESTNETDKPEKDSTKEQEKDESAFDPDEEVTLTFMAPWGEEQVNERFKDEFEKKYPNITIELISEWSNSEELEKLYAKNIIPDCNRAHYSSPLFPL